MAKFQQVQKIIQTFIRSVQKIEFLKCYYRKKSKITVTCLFNSKIMLSQQKLEINRYLSDSSAFVESNLKN